MSSAASPSVERSMRALVADDDPAMTMLISHVLERMGRPAEEVYDGAAAWAAWERERHALAVLDIEMPRLDGLELCRRIRAAEPSRETFIVVVTGRDRPADLEAVLEAGADDYVTKPVTGEQLMARLRIAERRMADDRARRDTEEQLRRSKWLTGVGEASVAMQHEISNPLTAMLATAELLLMQAEESGRGEMLEELRIIVEQARRMSALVKRLGKLRDPRSIEYAGGSTMIDLGEDG